MSKAKKVLAFVLEVVSSETDVPPAKIMSRYGESEVVDARWICVKIMREYGYYPYKIAELLNLTPRYIQYILSDFNDRLITNKMMRNDYERVRKRLRTESEMFG